MGFNEIFPDVLTVVNSCYLFMALLGLIIHFYIIYCYQFRRYREDRLPIQTLIIGLSLFEFHRCKICVVLTIGIMLPFNMRRQCVSFASYWCLPINSEMLCVLSLAIAINRY